MLKSEVAVEVKKNTILLLASDEASGVWVLGLFRATRDFTLDAVGDPKFRGEWDKSYIQHLLNEGLLRPVKATHVSTYFTYRDGLQLDRRDIHGFYKD